MGVEDANDQSAQSEEDCGDELDSEQVDSQWEELRVRGETRGEA